MYIILQFGYFFGAIKEALYETRITRLKKLRIKLRT